MKFADLPEGFYQITKVDHAFKKIFVQPLDNPDNDPLDLFLPSPIEVVHDGRSYEVKGYSLNEPLNEMEVDYKTFHEVRKERKVFGARISHITRRLNANEPLTGKTLELALDILGKSVSGKEDIYDVIANKLASGQPLSNYEHHLMVDVRLVHARF